MHPPLSKKQVIPHPPSKWVKTNGFNALLQWLLGFLSFLLHTSLIFSHINTPLLISVNIYLCKLLNFVCCNISGIESFLSQRFCNSIKLSSIQIKGFYEIKIKTGSEDTFQNHEPDNTG
jgi:hypothetical protein